MPTHLVPSRALSLPFSIRSCALALLGAATVLAQTAEPEPVYRWTTLAGRASIGAEDGSLAAARFNNPHGLAVDKNGNLYVADRGNHTVRQISRGGMVLTLAGAPGKAGFADGPGDVARFNSPTGIAVDPTGNIYVTDAGNYVIRKITPAGVVATVAGQAGKKGNADGSAATALFGDLDPIAADAAGNVYVMDQGLRRIAGGTVETLHAPTDGVVFNNPRGSVAVDSGGQVFFVLPGGHGILKRFLTGVVSTVVSTGPNSPPPQLFPNNQGWVGPLTIDASDTLHFVAHYFSTTDDYYGAQLTQTGELRLSGLSFSASSVQPELPRGLAVDLDGYIVFTRTSDDAIIRQKTAGSDKTVFAGTAWSNYPLTGTGASVRFSGIHGLAVDRDGQVLAADGGLAFRPGGGFFGGATLCRITPAGEMRTTSTGLWLERPPNRPTSVAVDNSNTVVLASSDWLSRLHVFTADGSITNLTGPELRRLTGTAYDATGRLLAIDSSGQVHRRSLAGEWSVLAGSDQSAEIKDGQGSAARFSNLRSIVTRGNDAYVLDGATIRQIHADGTVITVRSDLVKPDGDAPENLTINAQGAFILTYPSSHVVKLFTGTIGGEVLIGGSVREAGSRDGTGSDARFYAPSSVTADTRGNLFVADALGTTIRKGELLGYKPALATQPQSQTVAAGSSATFTVVAAPGTTSPTYQWQRNGTAIAGATSSTLTLSNVSSANAGDYTVVVANDLGSITSNPATLTVTGAPPPPSSGGGGSGGGGAPSLWFALAIAALSGLRAIRGRFFQTTGQGRE